MSFRGLRGISSLVLTTVLIAGFLAACSGGGTTQDPPAPPTSGDSAAQSPPGTFRRCVRDADSGGLGRAPRRDVARMIVSSAENSSLRWEDQYGYIEYDVEGDPAENRGYTGGIVGFTSKTHDMLALVSAYTKARPDNGLAPYLPALRRVDGTSSRAGLGSGFVAAWRAAADDPAFRATQRRLADSMYYDPAIRQAARDGLGALGQFAYVDALVMHGPGEDADSFSGIRRTALRRARPPRSGGSETTWIDAFLDARAAAMRRERSHSDTSRVEHAQRRWLRAGNLALRLPLEWSVYGDGYRLTTCP